MRRRYEDDGISDDEIEGKRTFDLEEKLTTNKFNANFVVFMEGKGENHALMFPDYFCLLNYFFRNIGACVLSLLHQGAKYVVFIVLDALLHQV